MASNSGQTSVKDLVKSSVAQEAIWKNLHLKESILKHKSRLKWVQKDDLNSKHFHYILKCRTRRNFIISIQAGSGVVEEVIVVKKVIKDHFESKFQRKYIQRPKLDYSDFIKLYRDESLRLEKEFTENEIKEVILDFKGNKSPRPYLNMEFWKRCWEVVGIDMVNYVYNFHST
ncbi:unnamed protein product [Lathyrus sativus]|nr:unnamed protein product [Lathyrus sativus]